jgi:hypothetical protein
LVKDGIDCMPRPLGRQSGVFTLFGYHSALRASRFVPDPALCYE